MGQCFCLPKVSSGPPDVPIRDYASLNNNFNNFNFVYKVSSGPPDVPIRDYASLNNNFNNFNYVYKSINAEPWYFDNIKRYDAEKQLLSLENDERAFLIRGTKSTSHAYSLSGELIEHIIFFIISRLNRL